MLNFINAETENCSRHYNIKFITLTLFYRATLCKHRLSGRAHPYKSESKMRRRNDRSLRTIAHSMIISPFHDKNLFVNFSEIMRNYTLFIVLL